MNTFQRGPQESVWEIDPAAVLGRVQVGAANTATWICSSKLWGSRRGSGNTPTRPTPTRARSRRCSGPRPGPTRTGAAPIGRRSHQARGADGRLAALLAVRQVLQDDGAAPTRAAPPGKDYDSAHYLLSWYYAWGGAISKSGAWAFRIGASSAHGGYQNPLAAYVLDGAPRFQGRVAERGARLAAEPGPAARVLPVAPGCRGRHRRRRHQQLERSLRTAARGDADVLRHGLRRGARLSRSAQQRVVRVPGVVDGPRRASITTSPATRARRRCWTSGSAGSWHNTKLAADGTYDIPSTLAWSGKPGASWSAASHGAG